MSVGPAEQHVTAVANSSIAGFRALQQLQVQVREVPAARKGDAVGDVFSVVAF